MNKIIAGIVAVLVLGSGAFILLGGEDDSTADTAQKSTPASQTSPQQQEQKADNADADTAQAASTAGTYVKYSDQAVADAAGTKRVVFFHAPWCSTCNFFKDQITSAGVPEGITVIEADYDSETELKKRYGVSVQSTFVLLDEQGNVQQTWPFASGLKGAQDLFSAVKEA